MANSHQPLVPLRERFDSHWTPEPFSGCWLWTASVDRVGYGHIWEFPSRKLRPAHRVSWEIHRGEIPNGLNVLHKCDVRCCVNPDHLFLGTQTDNMRDCAKKGRNNAPNGERQHLSRLTEADVIAIRESSDPGSKLAERFKVSRSALYSARNGETWKHVTPPLDTHSRQPCHSFLENPANSDLQNEDCLSL